MPKDRVPIRRQWKLIVTLVTILALAGLIYAVRRQIGETIHNFGRINVAVLLLIPVWQAINYHAYTKMYQHFLNIFGNNVPYKSMFRAQLELNFVNNVFPSGGVSGVSYFGYKMRTLGVTAGKATLVQIMKFGLLFISFQILLFLALLALAVEGRVNNLMILVASSIATALIFLTIGASYVISSKQRITGFFTGLTRVLNRIIQVVRPKHPETITVAKIEYLFTELHENYLLLKGNFSVLKMPLIWATVANVTEILTIYTVYVAFGELVNPGAVVIAYMIANFAGLVSVLPGGVGIYEALMTGVLAVAGVPAGTSIPVTIMYRIVNMTLQMVPGYIFYNKTLHDRPENE
jgi:glycosyltransferase 2 family protein